MKEVQPLIIPEELKQNLEQLEKEQKSDGNLEQPREVPNDICNKKLLAILAATIGTGIVLSWAMS